MRQNKTTIETIANDMINNAIKVQPKEHIVIIYDDQSEYLGRALEKYARVSSPKRVNAFNIDDLERNYRSENHPLNYPAHLSKQINYYLKKADSTIYIATVKENEDKTFIEPMFKTITKHSIKHLFIPNFKNETYHLYR